MQNKLSSRSVLVFWFETPPKVSKGAFNYVTQVWGNKVIYVCNRDLRDERKKTNWDDGDFGDAEVILLSSFENPNAKAKEIFKGYLEAIHIIAGFTTNVFKLIKPYISNQNAKIVVFSELPTNYGNKFLRFLQWINNNIKYRYHFLKYNKYIDAFLPLGQKGVSAFRKYGWESSKLYPFMYNPVISSKSLIIETSEQNIVRFLYVGRFFHKTKGTDVLMKASMLLKGDNWKLDLVGGYGSDADEVIKWTEKQEKVSYIGTWPSDEVGQNMMNYDVIIVPSRYDGWNLLPNEAIAAGIGTIVTDKAVSDEMITASGAGEVVPASDVKALANAMQKVIDNPIMINDWKSKAVKYSPYISSEVVGEYFIDILDYAFSDNIKFRPKCPWII